jgi:hypothetical protein
MRLASLCKIIFIALKNSNFQSDSFTVCVNCKLRDRILNIIVVTLDNFFFIGLAHDDASAGIKFHRYSIEQYTNRTIASRLYQDPGKTFTIVTSDVFEGDTFKLIKMADEINRGDTLFKSILLGERQGARATFKGGGLSKKSTATEIILSLLKMNKPSLRGLNRQDWSVISQTLQGVSVAEIAMTNNWTGRETYRFRSRALAKLGWKSLNHLFA